jgi:hypothetical protein
MSPEGCSTCDWEANYTDRYSKVQDRKLSLVGGVRVSSSYISVYNDTSVYSNLLKMGFQLNRNWNLSEKFIYSRESLVTTTEKLSAVELGYNVMKGTEYFVSL